METAQTVIVTYDTFNTYARHFGDLTALDSLQNEWIAIPLMTSIGALSHPLCDREAGIDGPRG